MKKILLATTLLAASTGFAAAEVTLSGDARMGIISPFGTNDLAFTSRARVKFTLSGTTDGGLEFGASFRADNAGGLVWDDENGDGIVDGGELNAGGAAQGRSGSVFISGAFGKLSMGDVDTAAQTAVGQVSGVGLTGLSDLNEVAYIGGGADPTALYEYSTGDFTVYLSATNPSAGLTAYSVAAKYSMGDYGVSLGYENDDAGSDHIIVGGSATFGAVTVKAIYGEASGVLDGSQWAVSADYKADALTVTAFYADGEDLVTDEAFGLGASYDLGGGASVVGGYARNVTNDEDAYDLGVSMSF
jgi:outer membrane protein OmpU